MLHNNTLIQFHNISLKLNNKLILDNISGSVVDVDRIGLVGINGSGKSSLLKALSDEIKINSGSIQRNCKVKYLPQLDLETYKKDIPVYRYLEDILPNWWDVALEHEKLFTKSFDEEQSLKTLSGGELLKLHIALSLAKKPGLLLLDEPTNHLDLESLEELSATLKNINTPYVIVSHNIDFLNNNVNKIWEIRDKNLRTFTGDYDNYKNQLRFEFEAQQRKNEVLKKKLKKQKETIKKEKTRASNSKRIGEEYTQPKMAANYLKNRAEKATGSQKAKNEQQLQEIKSELEANKIEERKLAYLDINSENKSGLLIDIKDATLRLDNKTLIENLNFTLHHGDRLGILGANGSGKSTFVNELKYKQAENLTGEINYGQKYKTLFVDQKYDLIDPKRNLIENIQKNNPKISYEDSRRALGNLRFTNSNQIEQLAGSLSGGETARLAFAMITSSPADLIILDEPTNNLDVETLEIIQENLKAYRGTIITISHDKSFLEKIDTSRYYRIKNKLFKRHHV